MKRLYAYGFSALMLAAVLSPALRNPDDDGFPLSTYPMFSRNRGRTSNVTTALAIGAAGAERPVPPGLIGTSETMQAMRILSKSVREGPESARQLCEAIAARIAHDEGGTSFAGTRYVTLVTQEVDAIAYLGGDQTPLSRTQNARCSVPAGGR